MRLSSAERLSLHFAKAVLQHEHERAVSDSHRASCVESMALIDRLIGRAYLSCSEEIITAYRELHGCDPSDSFIFDAARAMAAAESQVDRSASATWSEILRSAEPEALVGE